MITRSLAPIVIAIIFAGTVAFTFLYGPYERKYLSPQQTITVLSFADFYDAISRSVRGRVITIFASRAEAPSAIFSSQQSYIDMAMRRGIIRRVHIIVPEHSWQAAASEYVTTREMIAPMQTTKTGILALHEAGSIFVSPFSQYTPASEKSLVFIETQDWSKEELYKINQYLQSGLLSADLVASTP